jgi:hypothetical protein
VAVVRFRLRSHDVQGNDGEYSVTIIAPPQRSSPALVISRASGRGPILDDPCRHGFVEPEAGQQRASKRQTSTMPSRAKKIRWLTRRSRVPRKDEETGGAADGVTALSGSERHVAPYHRHRVSVPAFRERSHDELGADRSVRTTSRQAVSHRRLSERCNTTRRNERSTHAGASMRRSRSVESCASAHAVPRVRSCRGRTQGLMLAMANRSGRPVA